VDGPASRRTFVFGIVFFGASRWPPQIVIRYPAMPRLSEQLLHVWSPPWGFYRLTPRGKFIRTLWTGPLVMAIIFVAFYIPTRHVGLPIYWPLMTVAVLLFPWFRQLFATRALWMQAEAAARCIETEPESPPADGAG
jgi:hypothetical protein